MNNPNYKGIELLPLSVIEAARAGDAEAVERVLRYYSGYMNKLCTRTLYDENGYPHVCLDDPRSLYFRSFFSTFRISIYCFNFILLSRKLFTATLGSTLFLTSA